MAAPWWYKERGQWAADVTDPRTKKRLRWYLGPDEIDARRQFHLRMAGLFGQRATAGPGGTLADLAARWLNWNETNCSPATVRFRRSYLKRLVVKHGAEAAESIMPEHVEHIKREMQRVGLSARSINHMVRTARSLYRWAMQQGLTATNPLAHLRGVRNEPQRKLALTDEQVGALLVTAQADEPPLADWCRVLLYTGLRVGELEGLPWSAYDAEAQIITLERHKTVGRRGEVRYVPVSQEAAAVIARQPRGGEAIFAWPDGRPISREAMYRRLRGTCRRHPELKGITFHALRHTFISRLMAADVPEWLVQRIVGHSSSLMTRYYTTVACEKLVQAVGKLPKWEIPPEKPGSQGKSVP